MKSLYTEIESRLSDLFQKADDTALYLTERVLNSMRENRLSDRHFAWNTGYGYDDEGRRIVESIYASVFGGESALVRTQIVSGTHAISLALRSVVKPNSHLVFATGMPYDTIHKTIGISGDSPFSLKAMGVRFDFCKPMVTNKIDQAEVLSKISSDTGVVYIQRSGGYDFRPAIGIDEIKSLVRVVKDKNPNILVLVDNCYGEFVEREEPNHVGADLVCGSLIKNPGGGLALSGGYITGREDLVNLCADNLTAPGLGKGLGLSFGTVRSVMQGLFLAPGVVASSLKGAMFAAELFESAGYKVCPRGLDFRSDIIQSIELASEEKLKEFCRIIQGYSPVDSFVEPVPGPLPGYDVDVIMAAGTFVQGASIELSADAPLKEPYPVYLQGGLNYYHAKLAAIKAFEAVEAFV